MFGVTKICASPSVRVPASLSGVALGVRVAAAAVAPAGAMCETCLTLVFVKCPFRSGLRNCFGHPLTKLLRIVDPSSISLKSHVTL